MLTAGVRDLTLRESTSRVRIGVGGTRRNVNGEIYTFAQPMGKASRGAIGIARVPLVR
jgi:hypothetical protein